MSCHRPLRRALSCAILATAFALFALLGASSASAITPVHGVQLHSLWGEASPATVDRDLDSSRDLGANTVRIDVGWSNLEPDAKGEFNDTYVQKLDRFMNGASARGIKVVLTLWSTPCWASTAPSSLKQGCEGAWWDRGVVAYPPRNAADYGDISRWVTSRYGSKLAAFEVWNEPNWDQHYFWKSNDEAGDYVKLLKAAYPAAKAGNASVPVLGGAISSADRPFLERMYAAGAKGSFDAISIHPYNEWRDPADKWQAQYKQYTLIEGTKWIREAQLAAGDTTPLWLTEYGWSSCSGHRWCVSEAKQADYTARSVQMVSDLPYVKAALLYNLRNKSNDTTNMEDNFGLVRSDWTRKPVYNALKAAWSGQAVPAAAPQITVVRKNDSFVVNGTAAPNTVIKLNLVRCNTKKCKKSKQVRSATAKRQIKVGKSGKFRSKLGRLSRKHRGTVRAVIGGRQMVAKRA